MAGRSIFFMDFTASLLDFLSFNISNACIMYISWINAVLDVGESIHTTSFLPRPQSWILFGVRPQRWIFFVVTKLAVMAVKITDVVCIVICATSEMATAQPGGSLAYMSIVSVFACPTVCPAVLS